ncbi:hypothetical protein CA54_03330 [Symmachiella macrocystis]|uniref:Cytochrome C n=1 Tax=Symmachiella macrocystis TaxID=2527985 RepID=A0A5C6BJQ6_9PLAN|nr:hypothetical protein [Symmachiella macrocystis]TWU11526.1 hypothetical protein CA54_03330 [Symmachiella macrocystis]
MMISTLWCEAIFARNRAWLCVPVIGLLVCLLGYSVTCHGEEFPESIQSPTIDRLHRLSPKFLSGAQPEGEAAFRELKKLGVKTIISVDGTKPDVSAARKHGLRYVHLPIGYDGVESQRMLQIVKAAQTLDGPVFVHCHHGRHRGPAAAAICCRATEKWDDETALAWLQEAETSPKYAGLFRVVREFQMPSKDDLAKVPTDFPETAQLSTTVEAMVTINACWERLKEIQKHGFRALPNHPDVVPDQEALQLAEHFRELARNENSKQLCGDYLRQLSAANETATTLSRRLSALAKDRSQTLIEDSAKLMQRLQNHCSQCHAAFRDGM